MERATRLPQRAKRAQGAAGLFALILVLGAIAPGPAAGQPEGGGEDGPPTIAEATEGMERRDGMLPIWLDRTGGKLLLEVPAPGAPSAEGAGGERPGEVGRYLYVEGLLTGLGSNPVGLDRGQISETRLVSLRWVGNRLLFQAENLRYRALGDDPLEARAVDESFADAVLWGGELVAREGGRALVDFTSFVARDAHDVTGALRRAEQGSYSLDAARSAVDLDACLAFPDNLELEAVLTFGTSGDPGREVATASADGASFSVVQHHSLIRLPDDGYEPRPFHPSSGSYEVSFADYGAPLERPILTQWVVRHRLEKADPSAERSPAVEPLVYHLDPGTPEPVRSALIEGASWWNQAFEAAGFEDAFRVEMLPEDAHPLDVRYNVIQWVHRATRGWSYGGGIVDPRTGELIKGHVTLGSLRVRQDRLIFEGLAGTAATGTGAPDDPVQMALARIRQLSAHEVGHTLGLAHNFAASTYDRGSVMDYPAPLVSVTSDGTLDFSSVYDTGIGAWDEQAIRYAYQVPAPGESEEAMLDAILAENRERGLVFLTDQDARPPGAAAPLASLWDNRGDAVEGLEETFAVRSVALAGFGPENVREGEPLALLQEVLVPVYFYHRYQLEAAVKLIGGLRYDYALRGEGEGQEAEPVPAAKQLEALDAVLSTLDPAFLDLPDEVIAVVLPRAYGFPPNRELFGSHTDPAFDALGAAATAAEMAVSGVLQPERAARLVDFHRRDPSLPSLETVLGRVVAAAFGADPSGGSTGERRAEIRRAVQAATVRSMLDLASDRRASPAVRARTEASLARLAGSLVGPGETEDFAEAAHRAYLRREITRWLERSRDDESPLPEPAEPPPGSPIGAPAFGSDAASGGSDHFDWIGAACAERR
jgi:hypothetical protein